MQFGAIVGGVALLGAAVLVGIALTDDGAPEVITGDTSAFVFDAASTTTTLVSSTEPAVASTTAPEPTTTAPTSTAAPGSTEPAVSTTLIPQEQRSGIAVRVLNGGAPPGAARAMTEQLRSVGFAPAGPADAPQPVETTRVVFAPGRDVDAATVNEAIGAPPENVVPASIDDPNWAEFGSDLAVLVVLGPGGT